jgi:cyclopropane fatty-acyl-phospholipid synthase-like methyltransferase
MTNFASDNYIKQLRLLHGDMKRPKGFGGKFKRVKPFEKFLETHDIKTVLDYGCGKGVMLYNYREIFSNIEFDGYDIAMDEFRTIKQQSYDVVFSNDVLEHIEPEYLNNVLKHINSLSSRYVWLRIDTIPAKKILSDGRNAHLILENQTWWEKKLLQFISGNIIYSDLTHKGKLDIVMEKGK